MLDLKFRTNIERNKNIFIDLKFSIFSGNEFKMNSF